MENSYQIQISAEKRLSKQRNLKRKVMDSMDQIMERKEQEYIDHTLLAPEYMRDANNFIIDLINFPKPPSSGVSNTDTLTGDLQFPNTLFNEGSNQDNSDARKSPQSVYMPLNDNFLMPVTKGFNSSVSTIQTVEENSAKVVQQLLITDNNVTLRETSVDDYCDISRFNSRKALPHKKRISRKLKIVQGETDMQLNAPLETEHKLSHLVTSRVRFRCELCGHAACSQLEFFTHLKQHYEPSTPDTILAAMKTSLDVLGPEKTDEATDLCSLNKKTDGLEQVFQDVHFPFENFSQSGQVQAALTTPPRRTVVDISPTNKVTLPPPPPSPQTAQSLAPEEFSDTEDMLEGIRDKVFIEDTCDTMDLMTPASHDLRPHWFNNSCFSGIELKAKPFCDVLFNGPFQPLLVNDSESTLSVLNDDERTVDEDNLREEKATSTKSPVTPQPPTSPPSSNEDAIQIQLSGSDILSETDILVSHGKRESSPDMPLHTDESLGHSEFNNHTSSEEDEALPQNPKRKRRSAKQSALMWSTNEEAGVIYGSGQKKFVCKKCQRIFNSINALKYHHRTHSGLRPHQCDICARQFFALGALKAHMRTHTGAKPYHCEHCDRQFRQWGDLKYHITSIHTNEKAFTCEFCGKSFARKYSLVVHVRIHTSERNYKCEWCDKTFRASSYLQNHRKIHTGEKPYQCDVCPKRFRVSGDLKRHQCMHERKLKFEKKKG